MLINEKSKIEDIERERQYHRAMLKKLDSFYEAARQEKFKNTFGIIGSIIKILYNGDIVSATIRYAQDSIYSSDLTCIATIVTNGYLKEITVQPENVKSQISL